MDRFVHNVMTEFKIRSERGMAKYKTNLEREDLSTADWLQHLKEELMDATLYIERLLYFYEGEPMAVDKTKEASDALLRAVSADISSTLDEALTRMNTLQLVHQRMWHRVLENPDDAKSYCYTSEEISLLQETAKAFLSGDPTGK